MTPSLEELPLFPLHTVLFPFANLSLHIFEDRYREMVRVCLEAKKPFGVVLIRSGSEIGDIADPYMVGTSAQIVSAQTYSDGRMDIHIRGNRRFRIRELDDSSKPYLVGKVEPLYEEVVDATSEAKQLLYEARVEFQHLVERFFEDQEVKVRVEFPTDPIELSFSIANLLPMENLEKQRLLETTDTLERVQELLPLLKAARPQQYYKLTSNDLREWIVPN